MALRDSNSAEELLSLHALASMRSLIINPSTPQSTIYLVLENLTHSLQLSRDKLLLHHTLKLLSDLALHHFHLSHAVFESVRSYSLLLSSNATHLAAESLEVLTSISELDRKLDSAMDEFGDGLFVSLCFGPSVSLRSWVLRNAGKFNVHPSLLFTVFLGFTKDPYPSVRRASLDGLVGLSKDVVIEQTALVEGCYRRCVELLGDMEDCVRAAAVRAVGSWGEMVAASNPNMKIFLSDEVFSKLCYMARDMSMEVRLEAFNSLGNVKMVSENVLLQSLSKRVLSFTKGFGSSSQCPTQQFDTLALSTAGALVHGLEDEFFEVRKSACHSLCTLTILSTQFAVEVLNLLMDVLNDDSIVVRLEALKTMHHMAIYDCLKLQDSHMDMFLGALLDSSTAVRDATRKILKPVKLRNMVSFEFCVKCLLENLMKYPQDEADVFCVLSHIGRKHKAFISFIIKELFEKVETAFEGNLGIESAEVAALLILSISAPLSNENHPCMIPTIMFSYAVTLLGRIFCAFSDIMDRDSLLAYLSEGSRSSIYPITDGNFGVGEQCFLLAKDDSLYNIGNRSPVVIVSQQKDLRAEEIQSSPRESRDVATSHGGLQQVMDKVLEFVNHILAKVPDIWLMVQSGSTKKALKCLRSLKEMLTNLKLEPSVSDGVLPFTLLYLKLIKLIALIWEHLLQKKRVCSLGMGKMDLMLEKLDMRATELRSRFAGFSIKEEIDILELIMVTCILRLSKVEISCYNSIFRKLGTTISFAESLLKEGNVEPSNFVVETRKLLCASSTSINGAFCCPFMLRNCLKFYSLKKFVLSGEIRHIEAKLKILADSENPLPFVSGLPAGIPCDITLHNILSENRLWLSMTMDDNSTQYVFLDLKLFESVGQVRKFSLIAPFYRTPEVSCFTLRVHVVSESLFENFEAAKRCGGPKHVVVPLGPEKQIYLFRVTNR